MKKIWEIYYPWNPISEKYNNLTIRQLSKNSHLIDCEFFNIQNSQAIYCNAAIFILSEQCSFLKCSKGSSKTAIVELNLFNSQDN